jgi:hypothetical protein
MSVDYQYDLHILAFCFRKLRCKIFSESVINSSSSAKGGFIDVCFLITVAQTKHGYLFAEIK